MSELDDLRRQLSESVAREREAKDEIERLKKRLELQKLMAHWGDELIDERDALRSRCARLGNIIGTKHEGHRLHEVSENCWACQALSDPGTDWWRGPYREGYEKAKADIYPEIEHMRAREARLVEAAERFINSSCWFDQSGGTGCNREDGCPENLARLELRKVVQTYDSDAQSWLSERLSAAKREGEREALIQVRQQVIGNWLKPSEYDNPTSAAQARTRWAIADWLKDKLAQSSKAEGRP